MVELFADVVPGTVNVYCYLQVILNGDQILFNLHVRDIQWKSFSEEDVAARVEIIKKAVATETELLPQGRSWFLIKHVLELKSLILTVGYIKL